MTPAEQAAHDLAWVAAYWPDLTEARLPGTARPWRQPELTPERRAELDAEARAERFEYRPVIPGEHAAPVDVAILDVMRDILCDACNVADRMALAGSVRPLGAPSTAFADATPYLTFSVRLLASVSLEPVVLRVVGDVARQMVGDVSRALCLVYDGQRLDVECVWCGGGLVAGTRTWRVRELPGLVGVAIVCESGTCEPPQRDVGTWWRGRPCWPVSEWDWLAQRVQSAETRRAS